MPDDPPSFGKLVSVAKDSFAALRELGLLLALALLFLWPSAIQNRLREAGFVKADLFGFELNLEDIQEAKIEAGDALQQIERLQADLGEVPQQLEQLQSQARDPAVRRQATELSTRVNASLVQTQAVQQDLKETLDRQDRIYEQVAAERPAVTGEWVVVVGADRDLDAARFELRRLQRLGFERSWICERKGAYRTVAVFASRREADAALGRIQQSLRSSAFVADLSVFCPSRERKADDLFVCAA